MSKKVKRKFKKIPVKRKVIVYIGGIEGAHFDAKSAAGAWAVKVAYHLVDDEWNEPEWKRIVDKAKRRALPIFERQFK